MTDRGLHSQVERHFGFLVSENGYKCVESGPSRVRFESLTTYSNLVFDGTRAYELDLRVGRTAITDRRTPEFSIAEILRLRGAPEAAQFSLIVVRSNEDLASSVAQLARLLQCYGGEFIRGDDKSFAELAAQRQEEVKAYALERHLRTVRFKADSASDDKEPPK
jgi:hypothetical protein